MAKLLEKPEELRVTANIEGVPLSITREGKAERVARIYQYCHASEQLWSQEISKSYFRIGTNKGIVYDIYHDTISNLWYLNRIYDQNS